MNITESVMYADPASACLRLERQLAKAREALREYDLCNCQERLYPTGEHQSFCSGNIARQVLKEIEE
jgi:hypothetical protein